MKFAQKFPEILSKFLQIFFKKIILGSEFFRIILLKVSSTSTRNYFQIVRSLWSLFCIKKKFFFCLLIVDT